MDYSTDNTRVENGDNPLGFDKYWQGMSPNVEFQDRHAAAQRLWHTTPDDKKQAILDWIKAHGPYPGRNPYFFILDFQTRRKQTLTFQQYYAKFGTTSEQGGWKMENPTGNQVIYVKAG